jgi:hypothetical protein
MSLRRLAPAVVAAAVLAVAPAAALASTTATGYGHPGAHQQHHVVKPKVLGVTNSGGPTTPTSGSAPTSTPSAVNSSGSLPFTGFDLLLVLATGLGLVAAGFGLRRLTRREQTSTI